MSTTPLILPVLVLIAWTFVMWTWMYVTRIPAMRNAKIDVEEISRTGAKLELPPAVSRVADNYNHLHEQPTLFYALVISAQMLGADDPVQLGLAWTYVGLRTVHSLVQATRNVILIRFGVFAVASVVLFILLIRTILFAMD